MSDEVRRLTRVLVLAYSCAPDAGSEPGVGWASLQAARSIAGHVVVVTRVGNVSAIRSALPDGHSVTTIGVDGGPLALWAKRRLPGGTHGYYLYWQFIAARQIRALERTQHIDVAHHATFASARMPTALMALERSPLVWGPVGGLTNSPVRLWRYLGWPGIAVELVRRVATALAAVLTSRRTAGRAAVLLLQNDDEVRFFRKAVSVSVLPNAAVASATAGTTPATDPTELLGVGRLIPWKGWALAIKALSLADPRLTLTLLGEGPDRARLERLARRYGVADRVAFLGRVPHDEVLRRLRAARAAVAPSLHEGAGWAVAEALTAGVPVIGLNIGGVATLLRGAGGRPLDTRPRLAERMARSMEAPPVLPPSNRWTDATFQAALTACLLDAAAQGRHGAC